MRKWKWWILVLVIGMIAAAAVGIIREQRKASAVLAKSYIMYDQWGVLPEGDFSDPEAIRMAIDNYDTRWKQLHIGGHPFDSTLEDWQIFSSAGRYDVSVTLGSWSEDWAPLFFLNHVAKVTVRKDCVYVERGEDGKYHITACVARDEVEAKMAREDGVWKEKEVRNGGDAWMLRRYVLTDAQSAAELLREWDSKMNAAQKSALQDALQVTEQTYMTLEDAVTAARTIDIDAFCPLRP